MFSYAGRAVEEDGGVPKAESVEVLELRIREIFPPFTVVFSTHPWNVSSMNFDACIMYRTSWFAAALIHSKLPVLMYFILLAGLLRPFLKIWLF